MSYKVKERYRKTMVTRLVPGFGQKNFDLGAMDSAEVEKWKKRGVDLTEYFDKSEKKETKSGDDEVKKRFEGRVDRLLADGFKRVKNDYKHEDGKVIAATDVKDFDDEAFEKFLGDAKEPEKEPAKKEEK